MVDALDAKLFDNGFLGPDGTLSKIKVQDQILSDLSF